MMPMRMVALAFAAGLSSLATDSAFAADNLPRFEDPAEDRVFELSLDEAVAVARERSFRIARSRRGAEQNELRYRNARSQYLPRANSSLFVDQSARGFSYSSDRFLDFEQQTRGEFRGSVNADISVPIDLGGVIGRQVQQADVTRGISGHDIANSVLDVTLEVQSNYLNALRAQNQLDADEGVVREISSLLERSRGAASAVLPFLEVELANAQQSAQNSRENADRAQDGLKQVLRVPPETRLRLTTNFTDEVQELDRVDILDQALAGRPDIQAALLRVRQAEIAMRQAYDSRQPNIRVGAFYSDQLSGRSPIGDLDRFRSQGAGLTVNWPLLFWDNAQLRRNRSISEIQREQAAADVEELQERVAYDVRQQLLAVTRAEGRIRNLPDRAQAYLALQRAEQAMLGAPPATAQALLAQVSNARSAWRSAETATADAYIDYNNAVFRLRRLIGDGDRSTRLDARPPSNE